MKPAIHILIVEDELPILEVIIEKLKKSKFTVSWARSVDEAVKLMNGEKLPDLIWLDHYLLGKEDGLEFVAQVKTNELWKHIPIFVVSNTSSPENVASYIELGITKYYTKHLARLDEIVKDIKKVTAKSTK